MFSFLFGKYLAIHGVFSNVFVVSKCDQNNATFWYCVFVSLRFMRFWSISKVKEAILYIRQSHRFWLGRDSGDLHILGSEGLCQCKLRRWVCMRTRNRFQLIRPYYGKHKWRMLAQLCALMSINSGIALARNFVCTHTHTYARTCRRTRTHHPHLCNILTQVAVCWPWLRPS